MKNNKTNKTTVLVSMPVETKEKLLSICKPLGITMSGMIKHMINQHYTLVKYQEEKKPEAPDTVL